MTISVIIPTYNRKDSLLRTLKNLGQQTYPADLFEVIVVDDGSTDRTADLVATAFPFRVRYHRQEQAGATEARNNGANLSLADILVFMDDDMVATPAMLKHLVQEVSTRERAIALATLIPVSDNAQNPFSVLYCSGAVFPAAVNKVNSTMCGEAGPVTNGSYIHFSQCMTGVLAIKRQDFCNLGHFQDPTGGWPNWDDVDFGYRAHQRGFRIWRSHCAIAYHHDYSLGSLDATCKRLEKLSRSAAHLLKRYPELRPHLAYCDKEPLSLLTDPPSLLMRKALRSLVSSTPSVHAMRGVGRTLEKHRPDSSLLALLYRWILSAHMYKGYRQGLCELSEKLA